jgi:hypothetical protein
MKIAESDEIGDISWHIGIRTIGTLSIAQGCMHFP